MANYSPKLVVGISAWLAACGGAAVVVDSDGHGRVAGTIKGREVVNCEAQCSHRESAGFTVTLKALPRDGEQLLGWYGDARACGASNFCTITVPDRASYRASAVFSRIDGGDDDEEFAGPCFNSL